MPLLPDMTQKEVEEWLGQGLILAGIKRPVATLIEPKPPVAEIEAELVRARVAQLVGKKP